jgi:D-alanyl-D-alanine carboxypeptidase/D-alanyl-D-alanine-endopeptidase (penicillin-binding protein 4)
MKGTVDSSGVLKGDLILVASGDLCLGGRTGPDGKLLFEDNDHSYASGNLKASLVKTDPLAGIDQLAREIVAGGVKRVEGDILVDDRLFEAAESTGSGPSRLSPVVLNDNVIDVEITPGEASGKPAKLRLVPSSDFVTLECQIETSLAELPPRLQVLTFESRRYAIRGTVPVGHKPIIKILEIRDPSSLARSLLIERLRSRGVMVNASTMDENDRSKLPSRSEVDALPKVAEYTSPPLEEYLRVILKVSQNLHASTLPMLLAVKNGQQSLTAGLAREGEILRSLGVPVESISIGSGAGGSRADLVSPRATVALLQAMAKRPDFPAFEAALPVLGNDGTLAASVEPTSPARGHARAKTGTYYLDNPLTGRPMLASKALAGYMETADGRPLIFAFFVNDVPLAADAQNVSEATANAGRLLGKLCEILYSDAETASVTPAAGTNGQPTP